MADGTRPFHLHGCEETMANDNRTIGLIGVGLMGSAMARRLLGAGFGVFGYDVDPKKTARLEAIGGTTAGSVASVARRCERIVIAVFDTDQVETVVEAPDGILSAMAGSDAGKLALITSTCDPDRVALLAARVLPHGLSLLETPLSGTSDQVVRGEGVGLIGGDPAAHAAAMDILAAICQRQYFAGPIGNGGKTKLAINLILGLTRAAVAEGLVYAERLGLSLDAFLEAARGSAAQSQVMDLKGEKMVRADFTPHGRAAQSLKDFSLILESAARMRQTLPLATTYAELIRGCVAAGEGERDNSVIIEQIRRMGSPRPATNY
jgi:putative dehydrogenase